MLSDWLSYKKEKRQPCTPTELNCLLTQVRDQAKAYGDKAVVDLIRLCMSNGWQGIAWEKLEWVSRPVAPRGPTHDSRDDIKADMDRMKRYLQQLREEN